MPIRKMQQIIGLDLDGVIVDHTENRIKLASSFGFPLVAGDAAADIIGSKLPIEIHTAIKEFIYGDPRNVPITPLIDGAREGVVRLAENNIPFCLISRRRSSDVAISLLKHHGLWPRFFNGGNSEFVLEREDKNESAKKNGVTIYLDDESDVLEVLTAVPHRFLFDPLGLYKENDAIYTRIASWDEFIEVTDKLCAK